MFPLQYSNQERVPQWNLKTLEITFWPQIIIANRLLCNLNSWFGVTKSGKSASGLAEKGVIRRKIKASGKKKEKKRERKTLVPPPSQLVNSAVEAITARRMKCQ
ncbi:hypothetical protein CHARACLAT_001306 [Characodon lateralis]|uniref:Uncharacterized protein n=1 Tax=Characodon lateralis TaxID=208331 RepID=A0ABU7E6Q9_9TELE|nr:hypothetical protein [Characodon lateralis]